MEKCKICGTNLSDDLFAYVAQKPTCAICTAKFGNYIHDYSGR